MSTRKQKFRLQAKLNSELLGIGQDDEVTSITGPPCGICGLPVSEADKYQLYCARNCVAHRVCVGASESAAHVICNNCVCVICNRPGANRIYSCDCIIHSSCPHISVEEIKTSGQHHGTESLACFWHQPLGTNEKEKDRHEYARKVSIKLGKPLISFCRQHLVKIKRAGVAEQRNPGLVLYWSNARLRDLLDKSFGISIKDLGAWFTPERFLERFFCHITLSMHSVCINPAAYELAVKEGRPPPSNIFRDCTYTDIQVVFGGNLGLPQLRRANVGELKSPYIKELNPPLSERPHKLSLSVLQYLKVDFAKLINEGLTVDEVLEWGSRAAWETYTPGFDVRKVQDWELRASELAAKEFISAEEATKAKADLKAREAAKAKSWWGKSTAVTEPPSSQPATRPVVVEKEEPIIPVEVGPNPEFAKLFPGLAQLSLGKPLVRAPTAVPTPTPVVAREKAIPVPFTPGLTDLSQSFLGLYEKI